MISFKDNFSKQSDLYAKYRPHYPLELFRYLSSLTTSHDFVWDCGTGNGQAAVALADFYDQVIATDPSKQQIANAVQHPKVIYRVEKAEHNSLADHSVDLLTVANAMHWFDFDAFYAEARRVLKKNGILAAWCYAVPSVSEEIDAVVKKFNETVVDEFWQYENRLVEKEYTTIPFPFQEIKSPSFFCERRMNLDDFIGYLNTWSATQRFINAKGYNPTEKLKLELQDVWHNNSEKKLTWKVSTKITRMS